MFKFMKKGTKNTPGDCQMYQLMIYYECVLYDH